MDTVKLRNLLDAYGEYPSKYRLLVWRKMLRLPNNEEAYEALAAKGIHPAVADLTERFPIADRSLLLRLQRVASALAHWSPIFAEAAVVPGMLFPFVKAFGANEVHAFEVGGLSTLNSFFYPLDFRLSTLCSIVGFTRVLYTRSLILVVREAPL